MEVILGDHNKMAFWSGLVHTCSRKSALAHLLLYISCNRNGFPYHITALMHIVQKLGR